jgi:hypothetical protein
METGMVPTILDALVIILLAGTIVFAARLSLHLRNFRSNRDELDALVRQLVEQVTQAERAIAGLREAAREGGRDLQQRINEARALADELQFMNETGNNLAGRLEKVSSSAARPAPVAPRFTPVDEDMPPRAPAGFSIRDPEFEDGAGDDEPFFVEDEFAGEDDGLHSRAERELMMALRGKGGGRAGG